MRPKDYGDIKRMLFDEFMQENPSEELQAAFLTGMTRFEQAITEKETRDDLYDFLPLRIKYDNLKEQLMLLQDINEKYEEIKKEHEGLLNTYNNMFKMSKDELKKAKKDKEYEKMVVEVQKLKKFKDLYYMLLVESRREHLK